jgi:hypothetical protein
VAGGALRLLQWALAAVLGLQGLAFALRPAAGADQAVPAALRVGLGLLEAAGALLFLLPRTVLAGGVALALSLVLAAGVHLALDLRPPLAFLVDLAAIAAVVESRRAARAEARRG